MISNEKYLFRWKFFTLTIFKLKNDLIDLDGI